MMFLLLSLLACISCVPDPSPSPALDEDLQAEEEAIEEGAALEAVPASATGADLPPEEEASAQPPPPAPSSRVLTNQEDAIRILEVADPDAPVTQADLELLFELAQIAGAEASEEWIRSQGPRKPGWFGTTRAETLDWFKTMAVAFGAGVGTALMFWLRRLLLPLADYLGEQPEARRHKKAAARAQQEAAEQAKVSAELRRLLEETEKKLLVFSPRGARSRERPKPDVGGVDFAERGLQFLHED